MKRNYSRIAHRGRCGSTGCDEFGPDFCVQNWPNARQKLVENRKACCSVE